MKINVVAVGKIKEDYIKNGIADYSKRLSRFCTFNIIEVSESDIKDEVNVILKTEGENIVRHLKGTVIVMDINGEAFTSVKISEYISGLKVNGVSEITFVIGGSYGVSEEIKKLATLKLSFGKITYPHQLFRLILTEQVYRAFMIETGREYHK